MKSMAIQMVDRIFGVGILLPLVIGSCCISLKQSNDVFIKAAEITEIPFCRTENEPPQKFFMLVRSELNLNLKNIKQEQAKFWKQHPALVMQVEIKLRSKGR